MPHTDKDKKQLRRMTVTYTVVLTVASLLVIGGFIRIQLIDGRMWQERAERFEAKEFTDEAHRGNIYSSDGKIMATTIPICNLYVDFGRYPVYDRKKEKMKAKDGSDSTTRVISDSCYMAKVDEVCELLAELNIPGHDVEYYKNRFNNEWKKSNASHCLAIEKNIPYSTWDKIVKFKGWGRFVVKLMSDGTSVIRQSREHIYGNLAENCIGFWNRSNNAKSTGLDGFYNTLLAGQDGLYEMRRISKGEWIPVSTNDNEGQSASDTLAKDKQTRPRIDGCDIVATIDTRYQDIAETALRRALHQNGTTQSSGCAILMEASTGYVLACSNLAWDSTYKEFRELPDKNIACSDLYDPGSTIKTVILTAIMNDSTVDIDTNMRLRAATKEFVKLKDGTGLIREKHIKQDTLTLKEVLTYSSNVGMCELGWQNYEKRRNDLKKLVERVFPYDILHLDLRTGEYPAKVVDLNRSARDFLNFCYGYSQSISAMQLITFYNALANGGKMMKPLFCKAIVRNGERQEMKPVVMRESICSKKNAKIITDMLVNVVEHGTGDNIKNNSYGIAGKTGTADYPNNQNLSDASFAGYFPANNPRYTCVVVVKKVPTFGRTAAAPVFKQISDCVVALDKNLENGKIEVGSRNGSKVLQAQRSSKKNGHPEAGVVPDCSEMTVREAIAELESRQLNVRFTGHGRVFKQDIREGTRLKNGSTVTLSLKQM